MSVGARPWPCAWANSTNETRAESRRGTVDELDPSASHSVRKAVRSAGFRSSTSTSWIAAQRTKARRSARYAAWVCVDESPPSHAEASASSTPPPRSPPSSMDSIFAIPGLTVNIITKIMCSDRMPGRLGGGCDDAHAIRPDARVRRVLDQAWSQARQASIPMDAYRRGDSFVISFDLPGVEPGSSISRSSATR